MLQDGFEFSDPVSEQSKTIQAVLNKLIKFLSEG
jgi:hypothetical protein